MKKIIVLSLVSAAILCANNTHELGDITVKEEIISTKLKNVFSDELKSADLSEALMKNTPSIMMLRRSGVSNDIAIRGMKKDNINIIIDGAKLYGGCSNRMDPPISHVLTNNIDSVEIQEGPFDVENFGTLSGLVNIKLKKPKEGLQGEVSVNVGSFKYKKASASINGGNKDLKFLLSMSKENSDQYKDGNGDTLFKQNAKLSSTSNKYQNKHQDKKAYKKKTLLSKIYYDLNDNHSINLSYTANRSDDVLFANTGMDGKKIDSDIYTIKYKVLDLGKYSKELKLDSYYSSVNHPMTSEYRNKANMMGVMVADTFSKVKGIKLKNTFNTNEALITFGVDTSERRWTVNKYTNGVKQTSSWNSDFITDNKAIFTKYNKDLGKLNFDFGTRYDKTNLEFDDQNLSKDINTFSANSFLTYSYDNNTKYFFGLGQASRVPDFKEMAFGNNNNSLKETKNTEVDLGVEKIFGDFTIKTKAFYSKLDNYIYRNDIAGTKGYENIDAKVYGLEVSGFYYFTNDLVLDYALSYKKGRKENTSTTQTDKDLADIAPLRANIGLQYDYKNQTFNANTQLSDKWNNIDSQYSEQEVDSYAVLNLKYNNQMTKAFDLTLGMDNIFDSTYAVSNTYADISVLDGSAGEKAMINEPGRYMYINARYKF